MNKKLIWTFTTIFLSLLIFCYFFVYNKNNYPNELQKIKDRGVLLVGTTGDYKPISYLNPQTNTYEGFDIELSKDLAKSLGVQVKYIPTSWPKLTEDTIAGKFDIAFSGITITNDRKKNMLMSIGYFDNGKTILCRKEDKNKYTSLKSINNANVTIMENPGGLNEKFVRENLPNAKLIIHDINTEIPELIANGKADVMITETVEANYYASINKKLIAPIAKTPFTKGQFGALMPNKNKTLQKHVNKFLKQEQKSGRIEELSRIYIYNK